MSEGKEYEDPRELLRSMHDWDEFRKLGDEATLIGHSELLGTEFSEGQLADFMGEFEPSSLLREIALLGHINERAAEGDPECHSRIAQELDKKFDSDAIGLLRGGRVLLSRRSISLLIDLAGKVKSESLRRQCSSADAAEMLIAANEICDKRASSSPVLDFFSMLRGGYSPSEIQRQIDALSEEEFHSWVLGFAAEQQAAHLHFRRDGLESLAPAFMDTWRPPAQIDPEKWPNAKNLADVFSSALGFDVFEYAAIGVELYRLAIENECVIEMDDRVQRLLATPAGKAIIANASACLEDYGEVVVGLYAQQRFPLVFDGNELFVPDPQKLLRRFLDAPVELDLLLSLESDKRLRAEARRLLAERFEKRVRHRLERIVRSCIGAQLFSENELYEHFSKGSVSKSKPSVCDWVLASPFASIYFEATTHSIPQRVLMEADAGGELNRDIEKVIYRTKFRQIFSTFELEKKMGLPGLERANPELIHFGFVILPRGGLATEVATEAVLRNAPGEYILDSEVLKQSHWLPLGILNESDLVLLEGWAEHRRREPSRLLFDWKLLNSTSPTPVSLEGYAEQLGLDRPIPSWDIRRANRFTAISRSIISR